MRGEAHATRALGTREFPHARICQAKKRFCRRSVILSPLNWSVIPSPPCRWFAAFATSRVIAANAPEDSAFTREQEIRLLLRPRRPWRRRSFLRRAVPFRLRRRRALRAGVARACSRRSFPVPSASAVLG